MTDSRTHNPPVPSHNVRIEPEATSVSGEGQAGTAPRFALPVSAAVAIEAAIAALGFGIFVVWAWHDGGFAPEEYLPGGSAAARPPLHGRRILRSPRQAHGPSASARPVRPLRGVELPVHPLGPVPADALDGANRTLVYWLVFALFTGLGLSERVGSAVVLAWGLALAALGVIALIQTATATTSAGHFDQGRLAAPISYSDGDAALFLGACLPLVVLASRRQTRASLRLAACAGAVVLADLSVLSQSRGALVWFPCALVLYLAVTRCRLRALAHLAVVGVAAAPALPALLHVYSAVVGGHAEQAAVRSALAWMAGSVCLAALGLGALFRFERHVTLSRRARVLIGTSVAVLVGCRRLSGPSSRPATILSDAQSGPGMISPRTRRPPPRRPSTSLRDSERAATTPGGSRRSIPRASGHRSRSSDNFIVGYLRDRRTHETSRYPESVELRTFSETGIVGALLFLGFLGVAFWRAGRAARRSPLPGLALACFVGAGYWLLHASTDWFWELPALTGAGLALLAIAAAPTAAEPSPARKPTVTRVKVAGAAATAFIAAAALAVPWAAVSLIDAAVARGQGQSSSSLLDTAATLNPWSEQPALARARLAAAAGDRVQERQALLAALRRNPDDWYPYLVLGIISGREHQPTLARNELAQARRLSPQDLVVLWAQRRLRWGDPLTERQVDHVLRGE